jgi:hypothetical protein
VLSRRFLGAVGQLVATFWRVEFEESVNAVFAIE